LRQVWVTDLRFVANWLPRSLCDRHCTDASTRSPRGRKLALGVVVDRLDVGVVGETPECVAVFEDVATRRDIR
jgi:hypothetical protein